MRRMLLCKSSMGVRKLGDEADVRDSLGSVYNVLKGWTKQPVFAKWAKEKYPEAWAELEKVGKSVTKEDEWESFKIDRSIRP